MANINRIVLPNYAHHIRERGVRKEPVFQEDSDYLVYLRMMTGFSAKHDLDIWAYALMTNHVHLVAVPKTEKAISKALHGAHTQYAKYFNAWIFGSRLGEASRLLCDGVLAHVECCAVRGKKSSSGSHGRTS